MNDQQDDDSNDSGFGNTNKEDTEKIHQNFGMDKNNQENNPLYWQPGKKLKDGKYTIEKFLDKGGFGVTYLVNTQDHKKFVIKTLNNANGSLKDNHAKDDFYNETLKLYSLLDGLHNRHIIQIREMIHEGDLPCIVMEYIKGKTLEQFVKDQNQLSEVEAIQYIRQVGEALQIVHAKNILHRDIKPKNIIIRDNNLEAVLIDFGIARKFAINDEQLALSASWAEGYAPIEQYEPNGIQKAFTDVYGLAATLYFCVTGKVPTQSTIRDIWVRKNREGLVPPHQHNPNISEKTNIAILKGLELYGKDRPQSVQEWLDLLPKPENNKKTVKSSQPQHNIPQYSRPASVPPPIPNSPVIQPEKLPSSPVTDWGLYVRTALMGAGVWLIAIAIFDKNLTFPTPGFLLIVGVILLAIALIKNCFPLEQKIYQLIISVVSSVGIYIGYWLNREESIDILPLIISTASASFLALVILFIFQWFINGDSESS